MKQGQKESGNPALGVEQLYGEYRAYAFAIAYRLLGTVSDAEDAVHDMFAELAGWDGAEVRHWKGYLAKWMTNRCLNVLRSARRQRELYVGQWLPEPWLSAETDPGEELERKDTLAYAYMVLLERLTPAERVVFVLREAFEYDYEAIAVMLEKTGANCRKIYSRAKRRLLEADSADSAEARQAAARSGGLAAARARAGVAARAGGAGVGAGAAMVRAEAGGDGKAAGMCAAEGRSYGAGAAGSRPAGVGGVGVAGSGEAGAGGVGAAESGEAGVVGVGVVESGAAGGRRAPAAGTPAPQLPAPPPQPAAGGLPADRDAVVGRFIAAFRSCDAAAMLAVLTEDARLLTDGGARVRAAIRPILGADRVTALLTSPRAFVAPRQWSVAPTQLNGAPGLLFALDGEVKAALTFRLAAEGDKLERLYWVLNPEKLAHLQPPTPAR